MAMFGNDVRMIFMAIIRARLPMAAIGRMPLMIPDPRYCVVAPGSAIRRTVVRRAVQGVPSMTVITLAVFEWCILRRGFLIPLTPLERGNRRFRDERRNQIGNRIDSKITILISNLKTHSKSPFLRGI